MGNKESVDAAAKLNAEAWAHEVCSLVISECNNHPLLEVLCLRLVVEASSYMTL